MRPGAGIGAPPNMFANIPEFPTGGHEGRGPAELRHALFQRAGSTSPRSRWSSRSRTPAAATISCRCSTCGPTCSPRPGWRTTGTAAGNFLVAPATWRPDLRDRFDEFKLPEGTQRIDAPTPFVWIIGRTKTDGPSDYDAVHKVQAGFKVTPLSQWGKEPRRSSSRPTRTIDMKTRRRSRSIRWRSVPSSPAAELT